MTDRAAPYPAEDVFSDNPPDSALAYLTDVGGVALRDRIVSTLGGCEFRVPRHHERLADDHFLVVALGRENAARLCFYFGGETVSFPKTLSAADKLETARLMSARGKTANEIARALGVTSRHVRAMRSRLREGIMPAR